MRRDPDLDADLLFLERLRRMRADFHAALTEASASSDPDVLAVLRQDPFYQLTEFLYALRAHEIDTVDGVRRLAEMHNEHLLSLRGEPARLRHFGLTPQRLDEALFTGDNMSKLLANFDRHDHAFDQSDLARFLVTVMSAETCRKLAMAGDAAGFFIRQRSPYGNQLVRSKGVVEDIMGQVLREARRGTWQS